MLQSHITFWTKQSVTKCHMCHWKEFSTHSFVTLPQLPHPCPFVSFTLLPLAKLTSLMILVSSGTSLEYSTCLKPLLWCFRILQLRASHGASHGAGKLKSSLFFPTALSKIASGDIWACRVFICAAACMERARNHSFSSMEFVGRALECIGPPQAQVRSCGTSGCLDHPKASKP